MAWRTKTDTSASPALQKLRVRCLSFPETSETSSWGHPNFRAGKRTFAAFEPVKGRPSIAFRLDRPAVERLLRRQHFFTTPFGRGQWVSLWADTKIDWRFVDELLGRSYRLVALKRMLRALEGPSAAGSRGLKSSAAFSRLRTKTNDLK